jgi:single-strand DNA-binding protein
MATLNKVMLIGRLTDNPEEPRTLPNSGSRVVKFRFAVGRSRKNEQGGWDKDPNQLYIDCEAFARPDTKRDLVSLIYQYAKKGDLLFLEGRLQLDEWTDKNTNQKRSKHKLVVESVEFLGSRNQDGGGGGEGARQTGGGGRSGGSAPPPDDSDDGPSGGGGSGNDPIPF